MTGATAEANLAHVVEFGSVRPCDECGRLYPWDNPDAPVRLCLGCMSEP